MPRRLSTLAAAASLVLCVATVVLWVRSYWYVDDMYRSTGELGWTGHGLELDRGRIVYVRHLNAFEATEPRFHFATHRHEPELRWLIDEINSTARTYQPRDGYAHQWLGFRIGKGASGMGHVRWLVVPLWAVATIAAVPPLIGSVRTVRRARRTANSLCLNCGYDLRATPGRCPECGRVPAGAARSV